MRVWLALIKFRYHVTFVSVLCGAGLFAPRIDLTLVVRLLLLYVCFNVLVYGGIYTFNDIADRAADARHPGKRSRPVASGAVSVRAAGLFAVFLITAGITLACLLFHAAILACFGMALVFNACYSLAARNRRYLDLVFNSVTHPNRFLMGALLVGQVPPFTHLAALMMLAVALACLRRDVERDAPGWEARETIGDYRPRELAVLAAGCLTGLTVLGVLFARTAPGFYLIVGGTAALVAVGGWLDTAVRGGLRTIWTR
ncbi:MAG TPA: UbiA family prenyltransferase [Vicinamibacterales bacterium]|nr:UbiA family prenyltransferase [Vicinamibacterales bacterium]